jgi:hypothetical protein
MSHPQLDYLAAASGYWVLVALPAGLGVIEWTQSIRNRFHFIELLLISRMGRVFDHAITFVVEARGDVREHDDSDIFLGSGLATGRSEHHDCKTSGGQQEDKSQFHTVLPEMVQHRRSPYALKDRPVILLLKSTLACNPARTESRSLVTV